MEIIFKLTKSLLNLERTEHHEITKNKIMKTITQIKTFCWNHFAFATFQWITSIDTAAR